MQRGNLLLGGSFNFVSFCCSSSGGRFSEFGTCCLLFGTDPEGLYPIDFVGTGRIDPTCCTVKDS